MFGGFFNKKSKLVLVDPVFGEIEYDGKGNWEKKTFANFGNCETLVWVDASEKGPTQEQQDFFVKVMGSQIEIIERARLAITEYFDEHGIAKRVVGKLLPRILFVPNAREDNTFYWKIWFNSDENIDTSYGVEIDDWHRMIPFAED